MKFYGTATVGTKGQVVIPADARDKLKIEEGDKLLAIGLPMKNGVVFVKADTLETMMQDIQQDLSAIHQEVRKSKVEE